MISSIDSQLPTVQHLGPRTCVCELQKQGELLELHYPFVEAEVKQAVEPKTESFGSLWLRSGYIGPRFCIDFFRCKSAVI